MTEFIKAVKRFLGLANMREDAEWFFNQYRMVNIFIFEYLNIWCMECFKEPSLKNLGYSKDMHTTMAARITHYLLGNDKDKIVGNLTPRMLNDIKLANRHVKKWADDVMEKDKYFCELVVQTLRMYSTFKSYSLSNNYKHGCKIFDNSDEGKRIFNLLMKYGKSIRREPNPKNYALLLQKWYLWFDSIKNLLKK